MQDTDTCGLPRSECLNPILTAVRVFRMEQQALTASHFHISSLHFVSVMQGGPLVVKWVQYQKGAPLIHSGN